MYHRPIWWGHSFFSWSCFSYDSSLCQISSGVSYLELAILTILYLLRLAIDIQSMEVESALARITLLKLDSIRQVKSYPAAPMKGNRLVMSLGHLLPLQRFWSHALPNSGMPWTHNNSGKWHPRHVAHGWLISLHNTPILTAEKIRSDESIF